MRWPIGSMTCSACEPVEEEPVKLYGRGNCPVGRRGPEAAARCRNVLARARGFGLGNWLCGTARASLNARLHGVRELRLPASVAPFASLFGRSNKG